MRLGTLHRYWSRLVTGDGLRKTRLHTCSGTLIDLPGLLYLPHSLWSTVLWKVFGYRQHVPWLGYRAVRRLESIIRPDWTILEFGSGMSTLLFAQLAGHLVSVETDPSWYDKVQQLLRAYGITHVDHRLCPPGQHTFHPDLAAHSFDLIVVDGFARDLEAAVAVDKVKPGGHIFLDNSDVPWPEYQAARRLVLEAAAPGGVWVFNDFCPFAVQVNESMLVKVKDAA